MLESNLALGERLKPLVADVTGILESLSAEGRNVLFEGAQGAMLDVDLGTYPFVTSSTTSAGGAAPGTGLGPRRFHEVLGIVKAYTTRVGARAVPDRVVRRVRRAPVARRPRIRLGHRTPAPLRLVRCGRAAPLDRHSSCSSLCVTKLDVLDGLDTIRVCVGYRIDGAVIATPPLLSEQFGDCEAVYEDLPGWKETQRRHHPLRGAAARTRRSYLERLEALLGVPIDIVSTGPDREQTIVRQHPFA